MARSNLLLFQIDDFLELHASRILVLIYRCGGEIFGRTKLAKLDFFLRYPMALKKLYELNIVRQGTFDKRLFVEANLIESKMIRYRYGPWDPKYPENIIYLQSLGLIDVQTGRTEIYHLTQKGRDAVEKFLQDKSFERIDFHAQAVNETFGDWSGNQLKNLIYDYFDEMTKLPLGAKIDTLE